jgi:hypothetical protein
MADNNIKKVIIKKEDLPGIDGSNFSYNVRYRIIQNDKNLSSAWSNFYNLSAAKQEVTTKLPYTYSKEDVTNSLGNLVKQVKLTWNPSTSLKLRQFDVFLGRDLVGKMNNGAILSTGATSYDLADEDADIEVGQVIIGDGFDSDTRIVAIQGTKIFFDKPTIANINDGTFHSYYGTKNCYVTGIDTGIEKALGTVVSGGSAGSYSVVCNITTGLANLATSLLMRVSSGTGRLEALTRIESFSVVGSQATITFTKAVPIGEDLQVGDTIQFLLFDKLETGQFTFFGRNNFAAGEVVNITGATTAEFNGRFEVLEKGLSSTQFTLAIFKDFSLFQLQNPTFDPTSSTAKVYAYNHYQTTTSPIVQIPRKNYETVFYIRLQQVGYPKVARKKLELFSTSAIPVNI